MNRRSPRSIALACLFGSALIGAGPALAADIPKETDLRLPPAADGEPRFPALKGTFTLQWENDIIADTDRNYTNGIRLAWLSPENEMPDWLVPMYRHLPLLDDDGIPWIGFSLGQSLFTPEDIGARTLIEDDRPYAAWLYGGLGFLSDTGDHLDTFEIDFGVIGPPAMGEPTQNLVHDVINAQKANGWDNQLNFEPGMVVYFERKWRAIWDNAPLGLQADVVPHVGLAAGNIHTYGATGLTFRLGDDLRGDYGAPRIRPISAAWVESTRPAFPEPISLSSAMASAGISLPVSKDVRWRATSSSTATPSATATASTSAISRAISRVAWPSSWAPHA